MSNVKDLCLIFFILSTVFFCIKSYYWKIKYFNQKKFFINTLSHDFRVAIIGIIRGIEILNKNTSNKKEIIENLTESAEFAFEILSMLLNSLSSIKSYKKQKTEKFDISCIIKKACANLSQEAVKNNVHFKFVTEESSAEIDIKSISRAFGILLNTALVNTVKNNIISCNVKNSGKNIIAEIIYNNLSNNNNFTEIGHDIKLFFCKKIIEMHKGSFDFKNNKNSTNSFIITLPAASG